MLFQTCSKFTFGLSDVFVVTVTTRNRISGVGSLFFNDRILRFGKNLPQSLKRFLSNFNIVGIQNSLDGFHNTLKRKFATRLKEHQKAVFFGKKENSALSEHTCLTNHIIEWDKFKIITTNWHYHQRLCLEAWHINSTHAPLNRDDGGLLPEAHFTPRQKKGS